MIERAAIVPPGWEREYAELRYAPGLRAGRALHISGHGGATEDDTFPKDPEAQIRQAFRNVAETLRAAGASWADVVSATSYHVGLHEQTRTFLAIHHEFVSEPYPAWTAVGVTELLHPEMIIEISVVAELPDYAAG